MKVGYSLDKTHIQKYTKQHHQKSDPNLTYYMINDMVYQMTMVIPLLLHKIYIDTNMCIMRVANLRT
jgi:hypothetical protein